MTWNRLTGVLQDLQNPPLWTAPPETANVNQVNFPEIDRFRKDTNKHLATTCTGLAFWFGASVQ